MIIHFEPAVPNSPEVEFWSVRSEESVPWEDISSTSWMLSMTISHCSLGREMRPSPSSSSSDAREGLECMSGKESGSLRAAMERGSSLGRVRACWRSLSMRSTFLPLALIEWNLQSFWSCSRLREWRAGELKRISVVSDIAIALNHNQLGPRVH